MDTTTIVDINCPYCGSNATYIYGVEWIDFMRDGTGNYSPNVHCNDCNRNFQMWYNFKYKMTNSFVRDDVSI